MSRVATRALANGRRIILQHLRPTLDLPGYDWQATLDDHLPGQPVGFGPTQTDAVLALLRQLRTQPRRQPRKGTEHV